MTRSFNDETIRDHRPIRVEASRKLVTIFPKTIENRSNQPAPKPTRRGRRAVFSDEVPKIVTGHSCTRPARGQGDDQVSATALGL